MDTAVKDTEKRYRAPALDKGLDILELLAAEPRGLTRAEIVRAMGKSPSEIYRMIERLVARDYVSRSVQGDRYELTMKMFLLGVKHPPMRRLRAQAQPLMDVFADITLQSVHLTALDRSHVVVIAQASGPANWEFRLRIGSELGLLTTSSGEVLLAFQDEATLENLITKASASTKNSVEQNKDAILPKLSKIREVGYRLANSLQLIGVTDISVPILDNENKAFAVLTCPYIRRIDEEHIKKHPAKPEETLNHLRVLAQNISIR